MGSIMQTFECCALKGRLCLLPLAQAANIHPWVYAVLSFYKVDNGYGIANSRQIQFNILYLVEKLGKPEFSIIVMENTVF